MGHGYWERNIIFWYIVIITGVGENKDQTNQRGRESNPGKARQTRITKVSQT